MKEDNLKKILLSYKNNIERLIDLENIRYNQKISINMVDYYINNIDYEDNSEAKSYIIVYNGNPLITLYLSIKSILNNKNIVFMVSDDYFYETNKFLIDLFNKIIKSNKLKNIIKIYFNFDENKLLENSNICDEIIYIDDKYDLLRLKQNSKVPVEYNGYNTVYVYYEDSEENYKILNEIDEYCKYNNITLQTLEDNDILENIRIINSIAQNYMCIILSQDVDKQKDFKERVRSAYIVINENPFKDNKYIFKCKI